MNSRYFYSSKLQNNHLRTAKKIGLIIGIVVGGYLITSIALYTIWTFTEPEIIERYKDRLDMRYQTMDECIVKEENDKIGLIQECYLKMIPKEGYGICPGESRGELMWVEKSCFFKSNNDE